MSKLWVSTLLIVSNSISIIYVSFFRMIGVSIIVLSFVLWINAQEIKRGDLLLNDSQKNKTHWANCTIDGENHYDEECFGWIGKFITWVGLGLFVLFFLMCGCFWYCICALCEIFCCTERPREVIYTRYVYPPTYTQIP